tara:strand:- start:2019 stop:3956 length:1938 start_codon:yes stop_codon:yes gene_type:complete
MPKIPTFITEARPTAEVGSVKADVKVPLSQTLATALTPVTNAIVKHRVQEKNFENKTEALKLENEALLEFTNTLDQASKLDNKDQAFELVKTESERIKSIYSNKASNKYVKTLFNNSFYGEVQKGIFKVNSRVSTNIIQSLDLEVNKKKNKILTDAFIDKNPLAAATVANDLLLLYEKNYKGRIDEDEYKALIQGIPSELEIYEVTQNLRKDPRQTYLDLWDKTKYTNISYENREKLIAQAKGLLTPEIKNEWENFAAAALDGKEIPFDMDFAKEVLDTKVFNGMMEQYSVIKESVSNTKILNSVNQSELKSTLDSITKDAFDSMDYIDAKKMKEYYEGIVDRRNKAMIEDPSNFIINTNPTAEKLFNELQEETIPELQIEKKLALTEFLVAEQKLLGNQDHQIRVMSNQEANSWVNTYKTADAKERVFMLQKLDLEFGEYNSKALLELSSKGLPFTAQLSSFLQDETETMKFLSLDDKSEQQTLRKFLEDNESSLSEVRKAVRKKLVDFEDVIVRGNRFDTSQASVKMEKIVETLSYYAANELFANQAESVEDAAKIAANVIMGRFEIEDSFYVPLVFNGKKVNATDPTGIIDKAELIKNHYLDQFEAVAFGSDKKKTYRFLQKILKHKPNTMVNGEILQMAQG